MLEGEIIFFDHKRGYGVIKAEDGQEYFLHIKSLVEWHNRKQLKPGVRVVFTPGKPQALHVVIEGV